MKPNQNSSSLFAIVAAVACAGLTVGCGSDVSLGMQQGSGGAPGAGGATGTGGVGSGGSNADAALGSGGAKGGAGGTVAPDAPVGTGGVAGQTGGQVGTGGAVGTGGKIGTGGATGVGGSTGKVCGTIVGLTCAAGEFCDLASNCDTIHDAAGTCVLTGSGIVCGDLYRPVCGCDGKTYPNDCERTRAGILKASDGACGGGTGGKSGTGGSYVDGGAPGSGGRTGAGGATGTGGNTSGICGGTAATTCATGYFCDLASSCGQVANATGTCVITGPDIGCLTVVIPVCGCDGKTYNNDCDRTRVGMLKASDGACTSRDAGATTYPNAYLAWEAPGGFAGTGPAVVVSGKGWADTWDNTPGFSSSPETPPSSATGTYTLTRAQTDDLFARVALVNMSSLPHPSSLGYECSPRLYFRLCEGCTATTLPYAVPQELEPEMDPVWLWFDQFLGSSAMTNPRNYCNWDL
jgi:hypothetical protein